jgi:peptidoglycan/xylan/chitin deacetylase (PgdA/CDA1 family)
MKRQIKRLRDGLLAPLAPWAWRMRPAPRLLVLMYHRVLPASHSERGIEQPGMYVSPETLDMHLTVLRRHFPIVHLDDWLRTAAAKQSLPPQACALTFDDGWHDNFEYAFPVLRRHSAPVTIFLVSGMTGTNKVFWPNRLARVLAGLRPGECLSEPLGSLLAPVIGPVRERGSWRVEDLDRAIGLAKALEEFQIDAALDEAEARLGASAPPRVVLNEDEVHLMAASGLVRFGSHTHSHYRLRGNVPADVLEREVVGSGAGIGGGTGRPADLFCYPNGDFTPAAVAVVRQHYLGAVTTQKGWFVAGADPFLIPRIGVHEDISSRPSALLARIAGFA